MHLNLPLSYVKITNSKYSKLERLILLKERGGKKDEGKNKLHGQTITLDFTLFHSNSNFQVEELNFETNKGLLTRKKTFFYLFKIQMLVCV